MTKENSTKSHIDTELQLFLLTIEIPITAKMVSQLRAKTDSPMMECKKALIEAKGDFDRAEEILRVNLGNKATKVGSRIAAEGVRIF